MAIAVPALSPGVQRHGGVVGHVDPGMDVRHAAEMPDEGRALQTPSVVLARSELPLFVECQVAIVEAALGFQTSGNAVAIRLPVRLDELGQHRLNVGLLIGGKILDGDARQWRFAALEGDGVFPWRRFDDGRLLLLAVEHLEDAVGRHGLRPEDVVGVARLFVEAAGGVSINDRTAKGDVLRRIAVASQSDVPARQNELELLASRRAEYRHALLAEAVFIVLQLLVDPRDPVGLDQAEDEIFGHESGRCLHRFVEQQNGQGLSVGHGAKGNLAVMLQIATHPGAIGHLL